MFSLIVTIIAIVLVAALALATLYYGTTYAKDGLTRAQTSRAIQEGNQVLGAVELYKRDHETALPTGTNEQIQAALIDKGYLRAWPDGTWEFRNDQAVRTDLSEETCLSVNQRLGINTVPLCTDEGYENLRFCCSTGN